jgi:hypothetical protein
MEYDEIVDPEVVMARIRAAIQERRAASGLGDAEFAALASGVSVQPTLSDLRRDLTRLTEATRYSGVDMLLSDVKPSPLNRLIQRFRAALHEAILFYVNRLAAQQSSVTRLTLQALKTALAVIEEQQARIEALEHARDIEAACVTEDQ